MPLSKKELGLLVKEARSVKSKKIGGKFTQNDLAKAIGKSRSYIGDIEIGRIYPSYRLLSTIANECEVPLSFFGDSDSLLVDIIEKNYPSLSNEDKKEFFQYIKANIHSPVGIVEWELSTWKEIYDDFKKQSLIESCKNEDLKDEIRFKTPEAAIKFILEQPSIMGYGGFDINTMSDEDIIEFANDLLHQLKMLSYKYKK